MIDEQKVHQIKDTSSLLNFLREELNWQLPEGDISDITFNWTGTELNLSENIHKKLKDGRIRQLQPFRTDQPWGIFVVDFVGPQISILSLRQMLRCLVSKKRGQSPDHPSWDLPNLLFICLYGNDGFTFAHFKGDRPFGSKLSTFSWHPGEQIRTLCEYNLPALEFDDDWSAAEWSEEWQKAFDVEAVTNNFFRVYKDVFEGVERAISGISLAENKRVYTQRLFNRLMFIAFIQKKGWLIFQGKADYLKSLWSDYLKGKHDEDNFYINRLKLLFFAGLNTSSNVNIVDITHKGLLNKLIGDVPYLNGGLFEEEKDDIEGKTFVPDECFEAILEKLFGAFNFAVMESTPLDIEVAVDPEMLGKVFEELVTGRHETGSYYTPKPIVSFMCREGLKGYLQTKLPNQTHEAINKFVEEHNPEKLKDPEAVLEVVRNVKVCDPACGSGAYLLGMLHELFDLRTCLFATKRLDSITAYQRKLEIIQNNLYGVDLDPFAVNIARLRLWLSLAIEFEGKSPPPLPNLDFKIETGDSLTAPDPSNGIQGTFRQKQIDDYIKIKTAYMVAHGSEKINIRQEVETLKKGIADWTHGGKHVAGFDWPVEFAEVFARGGFDIVLANPPYIRQEQIINKQILMNIYGEDPRFDVYNGRADLYVYFYARAIQILNDRGILVFISSDKFISRGYAEKLRKLLTSSIQIKALIDFGEYPIFGATIETCIFIGQKAHFIDNQNRILFCEISSAEDLVDIQESIKNKSWLVPQQRLGKKEWVLAKAAGAAIIDNLKLNGIPLGEYVDNKIFSGIKTGRNDVFIIDEKLFQKLMSTDPKNGQIIKRWLVGNDIENWGINWKRKYLIFTKHRVEITKYPSILKYLKEHKEDLLERATVGQHEWYELQQPQMGIYQYYSLPKIVYQNVSRYYKFAYDDQGFFPDMNILIIPTTDLYIMGILSSSAVQYFAHTITSTKPGGFLVLRTMYVKQFPIPQCSSDEREHIISFVTKLIKNTDLHIRDAIKKELDTAVNHLFRLSSKEVLQINEFIYKSGGD